MKSTHRQKKRSGLQAYCPHPNCQRLLLWGMRILCPYAVGIALYIQSRPQLPLVYAKEILGSVIISFVILWVGAMTLDIDSKRGA